MILKEAINQIVKSYLDNTDCYLVDIVITPDNCISIEIDSFEGVSIDFCVELSKHIEGQLDREKEDFELEVSSAGLTSPFKVKKQYEKNIGNEVEVLTKDGRKISGMLTEVADDSFTVEKTKQIKQEGNKHKVAVAESLVFKYNEVKSTKYIFRFK